ncbi:MAG TPA: type-F conjugative transfer system pilin assembly protein TrbC [Thiobacillaceae bacterium]|jgi:conjugal transfer pilus assembly protein TrbC|nr:type-F conjugative transfer system pilin assembly protein TrbC [Thiobacillaceae bacterium]HNU63619.1 type-F conjugative transfer system pilin assembly protein TrbC [Thiobacillaceae bacterium]
MKNLTSLTITALVATVLATAARGQDQVDWQSRIDAAVRAAEQADTAAWHQRGEKAIQSAEQAPAPGIANWDNLPTSASPASDVLPFVELFQGYLNQQAQGQPAPGGLSVFVSLSMPRGSLELLVAEAERTGATLVLRGMVDRSISKTMLAVQKLIGPRQVAWAIDPDAFARFRVESVPVFVMTRQGARIEGCGDEACFTQDDYVRLAGDVSIPYALDAIERLAPLFRDDVAKARAGR